MTQLIAVEDWVGETRAAIVEQGRIVEIHIHRWSERDKRAFAGEVYCGRVTRIDSSLNAAFIDLGRGEPGFLPFGKQGRPKGLHDGAAIGVRVAREAFAEKGPTLAFANVETTANVPALIETNANLTERLLRRYPEAEAVWADDVGIDVGSGIEDALSRTVSLPGGGRLIIEPTSALTAIDIDSAGRSSNAGRKLALDVNLAAMPEIARQIRLRGLGGNVVIDCLHLRSQPDRKAVEAALKKALKRDPARIDLLPISRFGMLELVRQRTGRSLAEMHLDEFAQPSDEFLALDALRALLREAVSNRSAKLTLSVAPKILDWLETDGIGWREAMTDRIGPRFTLARRQSTQSSNFEILPQ